jgi:hypothetical protein
VRSALGASRGRILAQLFVEALALAIVGAGGGLVLARAALLRIQTLSHTNGAMPFWINFELSSGTVVYAFGLALLAAVIIGVIPGLKATGKGINANLHELQAAAVPSWAPRGRRWWWRRWRSPSPYCPQQSSSLSESCA